MAKVRLIVKGRVQGVFYRQQTKQTAVSMGISGWVRNRSDGAVEVEALGSKEQLQELIDWCKQGPPHARVESVDCQWLDSDDNTPASIAISSSTTGRFEVVADSYV